MVPASRLGPVLGDRPVKGNDAGGLGGVRPMCMICALGPSAHRSYRSADREAMSFLAFASVTACSIIAASIGASCTIIALQCH